MANARLLSRNGISSCVVALAIAVGSLLSCLGRERPPAPEITRAIAIVDERGGTVVLGDEARLTIPPRSLAGAVSISIEKLPRSDEFARVLASPRYRLSPDGLKFELPADLAIRVDADVVPSKTVRLAQLTEKGPSRLATDFDPGSGTAHAAIFHFSDWAAILDDVLPDHGVKHRFENNGVVVETSSDVDGYLLARPGAVRFVGRASPSTTATITGLDPEHGWYGRVGLTGTEQPIDTSEPARFELPEGVFIVDAGPVTGTILIESEADCEAKLPADLIQVPHEPAICRLHSDIDSQAIVVDSVPLRIDCAGHWLRNSEGPANAALSLGYMANGGGVENCNIDSDGGGVLVLGGNDIRIASSTMVLRRAQVCTEYICWLVGPGDGVSASYTTGLVVAGVRSQFANSGLVFQTVVGTTLAPDAAARANAVFDAKIGLQALTFKASSISSLIIEGTTTEVGFIFDPRDDEVAVFGCDVDVRAGYALALYGRPSNAGERVHHCNFVTSKGLWSSTVVPTFDNPDPPAVAYDPSVGGEGNFWGHIRPPLFAAGVDSNDLSVVDSAPYCTRNAWTFGLLPGECPPAHGLPPVVTVTASPMSGAHGSVFDFQADAFATNAGGVIALIGWDIGCDADRGGLFEQPPQPAGNADHVVATFSRSLPTAGTIQVCALAYDDQGNEGVGRVAVTVQATAPFVTGIDPQPIVQGETPGATVFGTDFTSGSAGPVHVVIQLPNGQRVASTAINVSSQRLNFYPATVPPGSYPLWVETPLPNGGISNVVSATFAMAPPRLDSMTPNIFSKNCPSRTSEPSCTGKAELAGRNFLPGLNVELFRDAGGRPGGTTGHVFYDQVVSSTQAYVTIDLADPHLAGGQYWVRACNYDTCQDLATAIPIRIVDPSSAPPVIIEMSPHTAIESGPLVKIRGRASYLLESTTLVFHLAGNVGWFGYQVPITKTGDNDFAAEFAGSMLPADTYAMTLSNSTYGLGESELIKFVVDKVGERNPDNVGHGNPSYGRSPFLVYLQDADSISVEFNYFTPTNDLCALIISAIDYPVGEVVSAVATTGKVVYSQGVDEPDARNYPVYRHTETFTDAAFDTFYSYEVGCENAAGERYYLAYDAHFRTPPKNLTYFRFAVINDLFRPAVRCDCTDDGTSEKRGRMAMEAVARELKFKMDAGLVDFVLVPGDVSDQTGWYSDYYFAFLLAFQEVSVGVPFFAVMGNHDLKGDLCGGRDFSGDLWAGYSQLNWLKLSGAPWCIANNGHFAEAARPFLTLVPTPKHSLDFEANSRLDVDNRPFSDADRELKAGAYWSTNYGAMNILGLIVPWSWSECRPEDIQKDLSWGYGHEVDSAMWKFVDHNYRTNQSARYRIVLTHAIAQCRANQVACCDSARNPTGCDGAVFRGDPVPSYSELCWKLYESDADMYVVGHADYGLFVNPPTRRAECITNEPLDFSIQDLSQEPIPLAGSAKTHADHFPGFTTAVVTDTSISNAALQARNELPDQVPYDPGGFVQIKCGKYQQGIQQTTACLNDHTASATIERGTALYCGR